MMHNEDEPSEKKPTMLSDEEVAKICHNANTAYCHALGDDSQVRWDDAPDWQKRSAVDGVNAYRTGRVHSPEGSHESWMAHKAAEGWKFGETKDAEAKTHPCMVPYEDLPIDQRRKDALFLGIVKALSYGSIDRWPTF